MHLKKYLKNRTLKIKFVKHFVKRAFCVLKGNYGEILRGGVGPKIHINVNKSHKNLSIFFFIPQRLMGTGSRRRAPTIMRGIKKRQKLA